MLRCRSRGGTIGYYTPAAPFVDGLASTCLSADPGPGPSFGGEHRPFEWGWRDVRLCFPCLRWWGRLCRRRCAAGGCARAVLMWGGVSRGYTIIITLNPNPHLPVMRVSTKSFVVWIQEISKSNHLGAQGTFKGEPGSPAEENSLLVIHANTCTHMCYLWNKFY